MNNWVCWESQCHITKFPAKITARWPKFSDLTSTLFKPSLFASSSFCFISLSILDLQLFLLHFTHALALITSQVTPNLHSPFSDPNSQLFNFQFSISDSMDFHLIVFFSCITEEIRLRFERQWFELRRCWRSSRRRVTEWRDSASTRRGHGSSRVSTAALSSSGIIAWEP